MGLDMTLENIVQINQSANCKGRFLSSNKVWYITSKNNFTTFYKIDLKQLAKGGTHKKYYR